MAVSIFWFSLTFFFTFWTGGPVAAVGLVGFSAVAIHTARKRWARVKTNNHFTLILSDDDSPSPVRRPVVPRRPSVRRVLEWSDCSSDD